MYINFLGLYKPFKTRLTLLMYNLSFINKNVLKRFLKALKLKWYFIQTYVCIFLVIIFPIIVNDSCFYSKRLH